MTMQSCSPFCAVRVFPCIRFLIASEFYFPMQRNEEPFVHPTDPPLRFDKDAQTQKGVDSSPTFQVHSNIVASQIGIVDLILYLFKCLPTFHVSMPRHFIFMTRYSVDHVLIILTSNAGFLQYVVIRRTWTGGRTSWTEQLRCKTLISPRVH